MSEQSVVRVHRYPSGYNPADLSSKCRAQLSVEDAMSTIVAFLGSANIRIPSHSVSVT
jgi:hypothetical protein